MIGPRSGRLRKQIDGMTVSSRRVIKLEAGAKRGNEVAIDGVLLRGQSLSPLIAVVAGVHGDEYDGIHACVELCSSINVSTLAASLIFVPIVNKRAFEAQQRRTPIDNVDLNRVFPGDSSGTYSDRLASLLFDHVICEADFVISLHGWSQIGDVVDYVEIPERSSELHERCAAVATAAGFDLIRDTGWGPGRLGAAAVSKGIRVIEAEVGGAGLFDLKRARRYGQYLENAIWFLAGHPSKSERGNPGSPRFFTAQSVVRAETSGLWFRKVDEGLMIDENALLGEIVELPGLGRQQIRAPSAGLVGAIRKRAVVFEGDELSWLFGGWG
jgi:predicted deacylase